MKTLVFSVVVVVVVVVVVLTNGYLIAFIIVILIVKEVQATLGRFERDARIVARAVGGRVLRTARALDS